MVNHSVFSRILKAVPFGLPAYIAKHCCLRDITHANSDEPHCQRALALALAAAVAAAPYGSRFRRPGARSGCDGTGVTTS